MNFPSVLLGVLLAVEVTAAVAAPSPAGPAESLRSAYDELGESLAASPFGRPIHLHSREATSELKGDMHAVIGHPFEGVRRALHDARNWCDVLILHLNTKHCRTSEPDRSLLEVSIGRKQDQPLEQTFKVGFAYRVAASTSDYFAVLLKADAGPYGTRDYRILLEAIPLAQGRTFIHLSYSYAFGTSAKLALRAYLATVGGGKVGFTVTGRRSSGEPVHIGGVRGMIERNTMRYYLAIESYLDSLSLPAEAQVERRLADWHAASERYPRQLHEMELDQYLQMKRREIRRLRS